MMRSQLKGTFLILVSASLECFQPLPFQGWCNNCGPCESDVKASLPFHGALLWPFHRVKPKEIHVHDLCGASLHSGTVRKKKSGIGNEKGAAVYTQDTWPLNSNLYSMSWGRGCCGIWLGDKSRHGPFCQRILACINMLMMWICCSVYSKQNLHLWLIQNICGHFWTTMLQLIFAILLFILDEIVKPEM